MRTGVVIFPGSNCDRDMYRALLKITGKPPLKIWHKDTHIPNLDLIVLPGGFSFGDYLRCGAIAARSPIIKSIRNHASRGGAILGVCNGFQILTEAELLPGSLIKNTNLIFTCRNTTLKTQETLVSPFLSGLKPGTIMDIPVAHNEGNFFASDNILHKLESEGRIAFKYFSNKNNYLEYNPNGSSKDIAGILSENGKILGMMPHPERAINKFQESVDGLTFLKKSINQLIG